MSAPAASVIIPVFFEYQRQVIGEAFQCPVRETYGMAEIVAAASECSEGRLHVWPEVGWIELAATGEPRSEEPDGEFVCTGLLNEDMPLIRYRVGDRGRLGNKGAHCRCGRSLPTLEAVEGRTDDVLYTRDGRCIGRLDPVFSEIPRSRNGKFRPVMCSLSQDELRLVQRERGYED